MRRRRRNAARWSRGEMNERGQRDAEQRIWITMML